MHQEENMNAFVPSTNGVVRLPYSLMIFFDFSPLGSYYTTL